MSKPSVVIDTNVVLDLLHFDDPAARPLLQALEAGRVNCVVNDATLDEWRRVLAYPEFALDPTRQAALFARYRALSIKGEATGTLPGLPQCSDSDDQKFIELAVQAEVHGLVSKDRAVLKLRRRCAAQFQIMTPTEAVRWLDSVPA